MDIIDCQMEGRPSRLYHVFQGEYVILNYINFDRGIKTFVAIILMSLGGGMSKSDKLEKLGDRNVSRSIELDEGKK